VGAIGKDESGRNKIDFNKCIYCGACIGRCPFGAVIEPSQIVDVLNAIKQGRKVVAMLAPATLVEFNSGLPQLFNALKQIGFADVIEVAVAADKVASMEANEFLERIVEHGDKFMTTSCCPSYWMAVKKHVPALAPHVSSLGSPMYYAGLMVREADPTALTCFIGPCVAKRAEGLRIPESINFVLTAHELAGIITGAHVDVSKMPTTWTPSTLCRRAPSHQGTGFGVVKVHYFSHLASHRPQCCANVGCCCCRPGCPSSCRRRPQCARRRRGALPACAGGCDGQTETCHRITYGQEGRRSVGLVRSQPRQVPWLTDRGHGVRRWLCFWLGCHCPQGHCWHQAYQAQRVATNHRRH